MSRRFHLGSSLAGVLFCLLGTRLEAQVELRYETAEQSITVMAVESGRMMHGPAAALKPVTASGAVLFYPAKNYAEISGDVGVLYVVRQNMGWANGKTEVKYDLSLTADAEANDLYYCCTWEKDGRVIASRTGAFRPVTIGEPTWVAGGFFIDGSERDGQLRAYLFQKGKSLAGVSKKNEAFLPFKSALDALDLAGAKAWLADAPSGLKLPAALLEQAARSGDADLLALALKETRKGGADLAAILRAAAETGRLECAKVVLTLKADPNVKGQLGENALHLAVRNGDVELVGLLLRHGANPNEKINAFDLSCLKLALRENRPEIARLLLQHGAKWLGEEEVAGICTLAAEKNQKAIMELLLERGFSPNGGRKHEAPILLAAKHADGAVMEVLIRAGADLNRKNKVGFTPLMVAANHGAKKPLELLRRAGVSMSDEDASYRTAADWALLGGHTDLAVELMEQSSLSAKAASRVLHHALQMKSQPVIAAALKQGARLDWRLDDIDAALEHVVEEGRTALLEQAWVDGMAVNPKVFNEWNLAGVAKRYRRPEILEAITTRLGHEPDVVMPTTAKLPIQVIKRKGNLSPEAVGPDVENGAAEIDIYIDANGVARFPLVRTANPASMGLVAQEYVREWRFNALNKGEKHWRRAIIPLNYSAEAFVKENVLPDWELSVQPARADGRTFAKMWSGGNETIQAFWVNFIVSKDGKIVSPQVWASTDEESEAEAIKHIRGWKYLPGRKGDTEVWSEQSGILLLPGGEFLKGGSFVRSNLNGLAEDFKPTVASFREFLAKRPTLGRNKRRGFALISFVIDKRGFAVNVRSVAASDEQLAKEARGICDKLKFDPVMIEGNPRELPMLWVVIAGPDSGNGVLERFYLPP